MREHEIHIASSLLRAAAQPRASDPSLVAASSRATASNLLEPLSAREVEVLRLLAEGKSNQEIADALIVGVGTIKTHLHRAYTKLGASSRLDAVQRARGLGLLG